MPSWVIHVGGGPETFLALIADQIRRRQLGQLPLPDEAGGWTIEKPPGQGRRSAAPLFTLADGRLGTTGGPLWSHQRAGARVLMAGVYEGRGAESHLVACPVWHRLGSPSHDHGHRRWTLDLHAGVLWDGAADHHERDAVLFASRVRRATAVLRVACGSDAPPLEAPTGRRVEHGCVEGTPWMRIAAGRGGVVAAARERRQAPQTLDRYVAYRSSSARLPAPAVAISAANRAAAAGFDRLLDEHRTAWARRWQQADIRIVGDDELQQGVRFALFHLMSCAGERGEASVGARGLSGPGYRGHVFWDADVFVLPFLAATNPASARAMLAYRLNPPLPAAMAAARAAGWVGARFPWESTDCRTRRHPLPGTRSGQRRPGADPHRRDRGAHRGGRRLGRQLLRRLDRRHLVLASGRKRPGCRDRTLLGVPGTLGSGRGRPPRRRDWARGVPRAGGRQRVHQRDGALEPAPRRRPGGGPGVGR